MKNTGRIIQVVEACTLKADRYTGAMELMLRWMFLVQMVKIQIIFSKQFYFDETRNIKCSEFNSLTIVGIICLDFKINQK